MCLSFCLSFSLSVLALSSSGNILRYMLLFSYKCCDWMVCLDAMVSEVKGAPRASSVLMRNSGKWYLQLGGGAEQMGGIL